VLGHVEAGEADLLSDLRDVDELIGLGERDRLPELHPGPLGVRAIARTARRGRSGVVSRR